MYDFDEVENGPSQGWATHLPPAHLRVKYAAMRTQLTVLLATVWYSPWVVRSVKVLAYVFSNSELERILF